MAGSKRERQPGDGHQQHEEEGVGVLRDEEAGHPLDVADHPAALGEDVRQPRELPVEEDELGEANVLIGSAWGVMLAVGAAIGGLIAATFGRDIAFVLNAATFAISGLLIVGIHANFQQVRAPDGERPQDGGGGFLGSLRVVLDFARHSRLVSSLLLSKTMAKRATGAQIIVEPRNEGEQWLLATVRKQAQAAGIGMPEVAVYDAPEINAFATGANRNKALVAVSTGLLRAMDRDEAEAVLGHEVSHVANGDMVTMTLIQGVLNTFVIFLARVVGRVVDLAISGNREGGGMAYYAIVFVLDMVFGALASIVAMWFSRWRECS